jgi:hypothetical protein
MEDKTMRTYLYSAIVWLSVPLILSGCMNKQSGEDFITLFNGDDISAWTTETGDWQIEDGILVLKNKGDYNMENSSYLWTKETYGDYVLELEFKIDHEPLYGLEKFNGKGRGGNSGVFIRVEDRTDPVQTGIEIQVGPLKQGDEIKRGSVGGLFDLMPPSVNMFKPGEWNHYRISCQGSLITVELNGEETANVDLNDWVTARMNPDGSKNKFKRPLKDFAQEGYIGLQDHGTPAWYRNIRIKKL